MALSEETAKIHRWLLSLPTLVYGLLIGIYSVAWVLALLLAIVQNPIYGNRILWAIDVAVLTAFAVSHISYLLHRRSRARFR